MARAGFHHHPPPRGQMTEQVGGQRFGGDQKAGQRKHPALMPAELRRRIAVGRQQHPIRAYGTARGAGAETRALTLQPGSGSLADSDSDGVPDPADECAGPGWRLPCDGDASNDGIYQTLYYNALSDVTVRADVDVSGKIEKADAYILMDATGSMGGEQLRLVTDLTSGTFVDPADCPGGAGTGILGGLECAIPDLWIGVGDFKEVSYPPHDPRYDMAPYHHYLDTTDNIQHVLDAVSNLVADNNDDYPEAHTQALYSVVTGQGLGDLVPNRGACPSTPAGRWGYPCFRPNVLPIKPPASKKSARRWPWSVPR